MKWSYAEEKEESFDMFITMTRSLGEEYKYDIEKIKLNWNKKDLEFYIQLQAPICG